MEEILPVIATRFIAIGETYDSISSNRGNDQLVISFINLVNASCAKDLSGKIRSARHVQRSRGEFAGNRVPYGYVNFQ